MYFILEPAHVWMRFKLFNVYNIIPSYELSKLFLIIWDFIKHNAFYFCNFYEFYQGFCLWFCVLWFFILCFGLGFLFMVGTSYFVLSMMCQLKFLYVILYNVWTPITVGANVIMHNKSNMKWNKGTRIIWNKMNINTQINKKVLTICNHFYVTKHV